MKNFETFVATVVAEIKGYLPEEYQDADVQIQEITKSNDRQLTGLVIKNEGNNIAPNIYLEGFFEKYEDGEDMEEILQEIANIRVDNEVQGFDADKITDLNQVKDHIVCKILNADMNKDYLEGKPHTIVEDLAVFYSVDLRWMGGDDSGHMSAPITDGILAQYGISQEELHQIAMNNLAKENLSFKSMRETLIDMLFPDGIIDETDPRVMMLPEEDESPEMYVLTNKDRLNGARAILDSKTMEGIAERVGGDFVIIPSSVHEVIIVPPNTLDTDTLNGMVQDVNAGQVAPEDRLSNHVYKYDSTSKKVVIAA